MYKSNRILNFIDGISAWKLIVIFVILTVGFAFFYLIASKTPGNGLIRPDQGTVIFEDAIYFSIVTEATLGYGDIRPEGISRWLACLQVLIGLILAGVVVTKITSMQGRIQRLIAYKTQGYWIESCKMNDGRYLFSLIRFSYNQNLTYGGVNYDINGNSIGFFTSYLLAENDEILQFLYSNKESKTEYFGDGIANLNFFSRPNSKTFTNYCGTAQDFTTKEITSYEGFRASDVEVSALNGGDISARREVIKKYASLHWETI